jgi:hypothetical protein
MPRARIYAIVNNETRRLGVAGKRPPAAIDSIRRPGALAPLAPLTPLAHFLMRCWLTLTYMHRFNYSRRLAWLKARR